MFGYCFLFVVIAVSPASPFSLNHRSDRAFSRYHEHQFQFSTDIEFSTCDRQSLIRHQRFRPVPFSLCMTASESSVTKILSNADAIDPSTLFETDIVLYQVMPVHENPKINVGVIVDVVTAIHPVCSWTMESAYSESRPHTIEFLMDEEVGTIPFAVDGESDSGAIVLHVFENVDYGSRQVGGGMGPGNPHGEDSEDLYYIESDTIDEAVRNLSQGDAKITVDFVVRPELEFFM
mmetsp:Transcript_42359/g.83205  ORF Transcript_42359/g.83205 Transcript_42359/m.83205 type:complete len:234 (-) Transcript_42359:1509-2210(-)